MEKSQLNLSLNVLRIMRDAGVLDGVIVIGSWCLYFYTHYFDKAAYTPTIRTRDIDFLVPLPPHFTHTVDLPAKLEHLGFILDFRGTAGYLRLNHPALIVEFLIPEMGRGSDKPYPLPNLGLNAQPLRYLNFLAEHAVTITYEDLTLRVPHPAAFALHKLIVFGRRRSKDKALKDKVQALQLLHHLMGDARYVKEARAIFDSMHKRWQKDVLACLKKLDEESVMRIFESR